MNYLIREIQESEYHVLEDFLYEAIYIPEGEQKPNKEIVKTPELQVYLHNFGKGQGDYGFVALADNKIIGVVWGRIMNDYGHIDDNTPSLALAVYSEYRGQGIGTALIQKIMNKLRESSYDCVSLSVQKSNPAFHLYKKLGFEIVGKTMGETEEEIIMRHLL